MFGIGGRFEGAKRIVAIPACHANDVRRFYIFRVLKIFFERPFGLFEIGIGKLAQTQHSGRFARNIREVLTIAFVEPKSIFIGFGGWPATWFRDGSEIAETAAVAARIDVLHQIGNAIGDYGDFAPKALVAGGPEIPGIAATFLERGQVRPTRLVGIIVTRPRNLRTGIASREYRHEKADAASKSHFFHQVA